MKSEIRGLSLWRPWPWAFLNGPEDRRKRIENRGWAPPKWMTGQYLALHAAQHWDKEAVEFIEEQLGVKVPRWRFLRRSIAPASSSVSRNWLGSSSSIRTPTFRMCRTISKDGFSARSAGSWRKSRRSRPWRAKADRGCGRCRRVCWPLCGSGIGRQDRLRTKQVAVLRFLALMFLREPKIYQISRLLSLYFHSTHSFERYEYHIAYLLRKRMNPQLPSRYDADLYIPESRPLDRRPSTSIRISFPYLSVLP
jgi:hypothetical protein